MGRNISATIAFGVDYGDEPPFNSGTEDDPDQDLGEYLAKRSGLVDPYTLVPEDINNSPYDDFKAWEAANPKWANQKRAWYDLTHRLENEAPVEVDFYGTAYDLCSSFIVLVLKDGKQEADWGSPTEIQISNLGDEGGVSEKRIRKAQEWCQANDIKWENPAWILYAMEG